VIQIRFSDRELDISGSPKALRQVSNAMLDLIRGPSQAFVSVEAATIDPAPYNVCLSRLLIVKTDGLIKLSVLDQVLKIEGAPEKLENLAHWFDFDDHTHSGYHTHFDYLGLDDDPVDPNLISLVIAIKY
jgi:hypothetical protein